MLGGVNTEAETDNGLLAGDSGRLVMTLTRPHTGSPRARARCRSVEWKRPAAWAGGDRRLLTGSLRARGSCSRSRMQPGLGVQSRRGSPAPGSKDLTATTLEARRPNGAASKHGVQRGHGRGALHHAGTPCTARSNADGEIDVTQRQR